MCPIYTVTAERARKERERKKAENQPDSEHSFGNGA